MEKREGRTSLEQGQGEGRRPIGINSTRLSWGTALYPANVDTGCSGVFFFLFILRTAGTNRQGTTTTSPRSIRLPVMGEKGVSAFFSPGALPSCVRWHRSVTTNCKLHSYSLRPVADGHGGGPA